MRSIEDIEEELRLKEERVAFWERHGAIDEVRV
jgi:hypothetical protein